MGKIYLTIFSVSYAVLVLEISLTRLFSIYLSYHFAYLVISIAMLGTGAAGTLLSLRSKHSKGTDMSAESSILSLKIAGYAMLAGISIFFSYLIANNIPFDPAKLAWDNAQFFYLPAYCIVLCIPFFFAGLMIASALSTFSNKSASLYAADLLGAASGSLTAIVMLNRISPEYAVMASSVLCFAGAFLSGGRSLKLSAILCIFIVASVLVISPVFFNIKLSPYKRLPLYLKYPGAEHLNTYNSSYSRIDTFNSPAVRFAPGLSLKYSGSLPDQTGLAIDGDTVVTVTDIRKSSKLKFLEQLTSSAAYSIFPNNKVLVIEPKGGMQVQMARHYGAEQICKVESNPLLVKVINDKYDEYSGGIYLNNTWTGYGRNFLYSSSRMSDYNNSGCESCYDIIDLPIAASSVSGIAGLYEDYSYTVEAFRQYIEALKKDGVLSVSLYLINPPKKELRLLLTMISALEESGSVNISDRIIAIRSWDTMTIMLKKSPLNSQEILNTRNFAEVRGFDTVYFPGITEKDSNRFVILPSDQYFNAFQNLINTETRWSYLDQYLFDIRPVYDNNPYFHYYLKTGNINKTYQIMGRKWLFFVEEGYLVPIIFIILAFLSAMIIFIPSVHGVIRRSNNDIRKSGKKHFKVFVFLYFSMVAIGFMFFEATLIQMNILAVENPSYSLAVTLAGILAGSGVGSMLYGRYQILGKPTSIFMLSVLIFLSSMLYPLFLKNIHTFTVEARMAIIAIMLLPQGFLMGIPFPAGIRLLGINNKSLIPWSWAVNACISVIAPVLTVMFAVAAGFQAVMWSASLAYMFSFLLFRKMIVVNNR